MSRGASALLLTATVLSFAACARALHEPPPLSDPGASQPIPGPGETDALLARAEILYARRTPGEVREAAEIFLTAARSDESRIEGLMGSARTRIWLADHENDPAARLEDVTEAVHSAQWCVRAAPGNPECDYWLGAAIGVQARERPSTGLDALPRILDAFQRAADKGPTIENGGPDRALALLYARAPGWPTGPGDPDLALDHARRALGFASNYPPNILALAEALVLTGAREEGVAEFRRSLSLSREGSARGEPDAPDWIREAEEALKRLHRDPRGE